MLDLDQDLVADLEAEQAEVGLDSSPQLEAEQLGFWQCFEAAHLELDLGAITAEMAAEEADKAETF